jgi:phage shock protein PspC (stress-responsive transcriptional regulator)
MQVNPRLYRSNDDRILAGVAGGLADYFNVDPVIVRILWVISAFVTASLTFWIYLIMIVVVPLEPSEWPQPSPWAPGGTPLGYNASYTQPGYTQPGMPPAGTTGPAPAEGATAPATDAAGFAATSSGPAPAQDGGPVPPAGAPGAVPPPPGYAGDWRWQRRQDRWQRRAERWQQRANDWEYRHDHDRGMSGSLVFGLLLIVVGGLVAWHEINPNLDLGLSWPIAIIAFGAILVVSSVGWHRGGDAK